MNRIRVHRRLFTLISSAGMSLCSIVSQATPEGGSLVAGQAQISSGPGTTTINQLSQQMVMDWNSFNIAAGESVRFNQPSASASALNRIFDQNATQIFGSLQANGNVFLFNNKGFLFGETASVNVGGLVATSLTIDPADFMAGIYHLASDAIDGGLIVNRGLLHAATGGVSLISDTGVINEGRIYAQRGSVNLATASVATLDFDGDGLLRLEVSDEVVDNLESLDSAVSNSGEIHASEGEVLLAGNVARDVFSNVVNNSGVITANSIINEGGVVRLISSGGDTYNSGRIEATSVFNRGGQVQVLGDRVALTGDASIDTSGMLGGGEVLVGGDFQGRNEAIVNASDTFVGRNTSINADAHVIGDGGKVIVWADETTRFYGDISATGGAQAGDGGLVEVSGKQQLAFDGSVDTAASNGQAGLLLLDPDSLTIDNVLTTDDSELDGDKITFGEGGNNPFTISAAALTAITGSVILQADLSITVNSNVGDLAFTTVDTPGEYVVFQAGENITFQDQSITLSTGGGRIHLEADSTSSPQMAADGTGTISLPNLVSNGGDITLLGDVELLNFGGAGEGAINAGAGDIYISESQNGQNISIGTGGQLTPAELAKISTTGVLFIGQATSAGDDGDFTGGNSIAETVTDINILSTDAFNTITTSLSLVADQDIIFSDLTAAATDTFSATGIGAAETLVLQAGQNITFTDDSNDALTTSGGNIILEADSSNSSTGAANAVGSLTLGNITSNNGDIVLLGHFPDLTFTGTIDAGSGDVSISAPRDVQNISLGTGGDLVAAELAQVMTTGKVRIGGAINAAGEAEWVQNLNILSIGALEQFTDGVILQAAQDILIPDLGGANLNFTNLGTGEALVMQAGRDISFAGATDTLTTNGAVIHLEADSTHSPTNGADNNGGLNLSNLASNDGDISLIGDENEFVFVGNIDADDGDIWISTAADDQTLELASSNGLLQTELNLISTTGALTIGEAMSAGPAGDFANNNSERLQQINLQGDVTLAAGRAGSLFIKAEGTSNEGFIISDGDVLTVNQVLDIDADADADGTGEFDVNGQIVAGNNNVTIKAQEIYGDDGSGNEIVTTGTVNLTSAVIGIGGSESQLNIDGATELNIVDTGAGNMELNFNGGVNDDIDIIGNEIDVANLNTVDTFSYTNTHSDINLDAISASMKDLAFTATVGDIADAAGNITAGSLSLTVTGADKAIGNSPNPIQNLDVGSLIASAANGAGGIFIKSTTALDLASLDTGTGNLETTSSGNITNSGAITIGGNASFIADTTISMTLDDPGNSFTGLVVFNDSSGTFSNINLNDTTAIQLQDITTTGSLTVSSDAGITQAVATALVIGTDASFTADGVITLSESANDFNTINLDNGSSGTVITVVDTDSINLGQVAASDNLNITAGTILTAGDITDTGDDTAITGGISVAGIADFKSGNNGSVQLDNALNDFSSSVAVSAQGGTLTNVSLTDASGITLQALTVTGNLSVVADSILASASLTAASLTLDSATSVTATAGAITVSGNSTIVADGAITLTNISNNFNTINLDNNANTASIQLVDLNDINLGTVVAGGDLVVTAGTTLAAGSILSSGNHDVDGNATFNIGLNSALELDGSGNDYTNAPTFNLLGGTGYSNFYFTNLADIVIDSLTTGNLSIVSGGNVSQGGALIVNLVTDITADGQIVLTDSGNDFVGNVLLDNSSNAAAVSVTDSNSIVLGDIDLGGNLTVTAGTAFTPGNISDSAAQSVSGNAVFNAGQFGSIELDSINDYQGTVDFNSQAGGLNIIGVTFSNSGDIDMLGLSTTSLVLESTTGGISSSEQISVTGSTTLDAAGVISLNNAANNLQGSIEIIDATDVTLVNNNSIQLATTANVSGTLDMRAAGNLSSAVTINADRLLIDAVTLGALNTDVNTLGISLSTASAIAVNNNGGFAVDASGITAFNGAITLAAVGSGDMSLSGDVQNQNGTGSINLQANSGSIINAGGVLTTAGNVDLDALNGIGADGSPVQVSSAAGLLLTTTASNADIFVQHDDDLSLFSFSVSTNGASAQTVSLTAASWNFNNFVSLNFDDFVFTSTTGGITDSGGVLFDANSLKLDSATGIGSNVNPIVTVDVNSVDLASNGSFASGDIFLQDFTASPLTIDSISTDNTLNSTQQVSVIATGISLGGDIATTNDNVILDAGAGAFDGGGNTLSAASVGLIAQGNIDNITTDARSLAARSSNGVIDIASVHSGSDLIIDDLGVVVGLSTTNNDIILSSQDASIDIATAINAGITGSVSLTTTESAVVADHDIGGLALVTAGGGLSLNADGGVSGVLVDLDSSSLDLTSAGIGSAGDISIVISDGMTTSRINTLDTDNGSSQDVTLTAASWNVNSNLDADNDNLALIASSGNIVRTSGSLTANDLSLIANSADASIGGLGSPTEPIEIALLGELTASAGTGAGGIFIHSPSSAIVVSNTGLNAGSGEIHLTSSSSITGNGQLAASNLLLVSAGDIDVNTTIDLVALSAGSGDITLNNTGNLIIGSQTHADTTIYNGITTSGDLNLTATGVIDDSISGSIIASDVSVTSSGGLNLDSAQHATTSFGASDLAGGNLQLNHQGVLVLTGLTTTGNASITNDSSVNSSSGVIDISSFSLQSVGGASLDNAANAIDSVSVTDTGAGDITVVDNGDLTLDLISTTGNGDISIITDGNVSQQQNVGSGTGNISIESTNGSIVMQDGTVTRTDGGTIQYRTNGGDITVALLDAGLAAGSIGINAQLGVGRVFKAGTDITAPNVSANTIEITSGSIGQGLDFGLDDSITGIITLNYTTTAFVTSAPQGADLNIVDNGPGVFNSSGARSAGNQRGQSSGLEDVGFIDTALFSDINLFVVDGTGIGLPEDQSDISPEDRRRFRDIETELETAEDEQ